MSILDHERSSTLPRYVVAFDHRGSLDRALCGIGAVSTPERTHRIKLLIWQSIEQVLPLLPDRLEAGILIDRGHPRIAAEAQEARVSVALALEASGYAMLRADADAHVLNADLRAVAGGFGKVLVRWHPDDTTTNRRRQLDTLHELGKTIEDAGARLLLELLVPSTPQEVADARGRLSWEEIRKPRCQVEAVEEILGSGLAPEFWKMEGHANVDEAARLASLVGYDCPDAAILLLGGGVAIPQLRRLFSCSTASKRYRGFAVGRSIWWEPVTRWVRGGTTVDEARSAIGKNFLAVVDAFNSVAEPPSAGAHERPFAIP